MGISNKVATICSIRKRNAEPKTLEASLVDNNLNRFPETFVPIPPYKEPTGRYRTGLDEDADYIRHLPEEEQQAEKHRVRTWRLELQKKMGFKDPENLDPTHGLGPFAPYYVDMMKNDSYGQDNICPLARLTGNSVVFHLENPKELVMYAYLRVHPRVAPSYSHYYSGKMKNASQVQFYVNDPEQEDKILFDDKKEKNKAIFQLEKMRPTDRIRIARLLGLPVSDTSPEETVYNLLDTYINQGNITSGPDKGKRAVSVFLGLVNTKPDNLIIKDRIKQALDYNILRKQGGRIYKGEQVLGTTEEDVMLLLLSSEGQDWTIAIDEELKAKKSITT